MTDNPPTGAATDEELERMLALDGRGSDETMTQKPEVTDVVRFFVDERCGCIAVRDRTLTDPEYRGLHNDTPGIVRFWSGVQVHEECETCHHKRFAYWSISHELRDAAHELCRQLNTEFEEGK